MRILPSICLLFATTVGIPAQTTYLVGPSGFAEIRDALAVAANGDIVLVEPGSYGHFATAKGVTLRALVPGTVSIVYDPSYSILLSAPAFNPFSGTSCHIVDIDFPDGMSAGGSGSSGTLTMDGCTIQSGGFGMILSGISVHFYGCQISSNGFGSPAMIATSAQVTAVDSVFTGSPNAGFFAPTTGRGVQLNINSWFHAVRCEIRSGAPASPNVVREAALRSAPTSQFWLRDCTLETDPNVCAFDHDGSGRIDSCTIIGNTTCLGPDIGPVIGVRRLAPLSPGATFALEYTVEPLGFVGLFVGPTLDTIVLPILEQPSWLASQDSFVLTVMLADAQGVATGSWPIPANPALVHQAFWFKGITGLALPLQVAPPVGGVIR
ncbi:MAG: hypothetical protein AB8H80_09270 [Planctomycetota bacterium]